MKALEIKNLRKTYKNGHVALKGIDLTINEGDFFALLAAWGTCQEPCCPSDLDLNGQVDVIDFFALLGNWSP